ncbi:MAG: hypothetical protein WC824_16005 [Bacteroidota bacterium]|jgi:hypothetical protein
MKNPILLISLFALGSLLTGCYYDSEEALYPRINDSCDTTDVTYAGSIVPILVNFCHSCHSNANAATFGENIRLQNYADVKANLEKLYGAITWTYGNSQMPKDSGKLSDCSIRTFEIWMAQGAPNSFAPQGGAR